MDIETATVKMNIGFLKRTNQECFETLKYLYNGEANALYVIWNHIASKSDLSKIKELRLIDDNGPLLIVKQVLDKYFK